MIILELLGGCVVALLIVMGIRMLIEEFRR